MQPTPSHLSVATLWLATFASASETPTVVVPGLPRSTVAIEGSAVVAADNTSAVLLDSAGNLVRSFVVPGQSFYHASSLALREGLVCVGSNSDDQAAESAGAVFTFDAASGQLLWTARASDAAANALLGSSIATDGTLVVAGANGALPSGAAYVFDAATGSELSKLLPTGPGTASDFGASIAIEGDTIVVGAPLDAEVATTAGAVYVFDAPSGVLLHKLFPNDAQQGDHFGASVDLRGSLILAGSFGDDDNGSQSGSAYVFDAASGDQVMKLTPADGDANDWFGSSVAIGPDGCAVIGAVRDEETGQFAGSAYVFHLETGAELAKYVSSTGQASATFGTDVAIGDWVVVGSPTEKLPNVGKGTVSYFFETCPPEVYCTAKLSSAGCAASIGTSAPAAAPVSGAGGYQVVASGVQELKTGLLFGGVAGPAAIPFNAGVLCVAPPLARGLPQSSGGSNPFGCTGAFATTVNDGATFPAGFDVGPGASLWTQYWYRDPQNGAGQLGTALSNAVRLDFE